MKTDGMFSSIERTELTRVSGGAARVAATARSGDLDTKLELMLTQIGDSIKDIGKTSSPTDQLMPMMMMLMMTGGGGGGGSGAPAAAPPPPTPSVIKINVRG